MLTLPLTLASCSRNLFNILCSSATKVLSIIINSDVLTSRCKFQLSDYHNFNKIIINIFTYHALHQKKIRIFVHHGIEF